jgi:S-adenosylmethionine/arginine decarboxylase-like enzyme
MVGILAAATLNDVDDTDFLENAEALVTRMIQIATKTDLTVVGRASHQFQPHGATCVLLLAESHFCVHTW